MTSTLKWFNIGLRGLMEFGIVFALGYWGYRLGNSAGVKLLLAIGVPLVGFGFWGLVDFRQAGLLVEPLRLVQELMISGLKNLVVCSRNLVSPGTIYHSCRCTNN